ncbi:MAG: ABC transporter substrate-binding protein [Alphaproteobacteria bacterium]|nr:ABC transporter substrate-binding protein [Alphaproteobacteria bacterium]
MTDRKPNSNLLHGISPRDAEAVRSRLRAGASRREVIAGLMAAGLSATIAGSLVTAAGNAIAATPKKGGRIRVAGNSTSTADTVDPAKQSLSTDYSRCTMFYNGLTRLDETLAPQLELAASIEDTKATDWVIKLRSGVRFHDGKPLTADDVVYSLVRHKDPAVGSKAKALADQIVEAKATGPNEVRVKLSAPNADFPVVLGTYHFLIVKDGTKEFATAVGTGPYKCKEFSPGIRSVATRNGEYWKSDKAFLDEIEFVGIPDESARLNALLSGDLQMAAAISPRSTGRVKSTAGFEVFETKSGNYNDIVMRQDADPSKNPDLVLALKYLMNREQMLTTVFQGYAALGNDQPIDPSNRFFNKDIPQRAYDPDKAKFHLQKSGLGTSPITLHAMSGTTQLDTAMVMQQSAQQIGMNLDVKRMPADGYWSNVWMKLPITTGNINPRPSADILFTLFFKSDSTWNESGWKNETFDKLLSEARSETDLAKRKQMYGEMQLLVRDHCGVGIPLFISFLDAHASKLKGLRPIPTGGLMGYSFSEDVWLDA